MVVFTPTQISPMCSLQAYVPHHPHPFGIPPPPISVHHLSPIWFPSWASGLSPQSTCPGSLRKRWLRWHVRHVCTVQRCPLQPGVKMEKRKRGPRIRTQKVLLHPVLPSLFSSRNSTPPHFEYKFDSVRALHKLLVSWYSLR